MISNTQRFTFTNQFGERWYLDVDFESETALLTGDELGDDTIEIAADRIQEPDLILAAEEKQWLDGVWFELFGRRLVPTLFDRLASLLAL